MTTTSVHVPSFIPTDTFRPVLPTPPNRWTSTVLTDKAISWTQVGFSFTSTIDTHEVLVTPLQCLVDGEDASTHDNWTAYSVIFARVIRCEKV